MVDNHTTPSGTLGTFIPTQLIGPSSFVSQNDGDLLVSTSPVGSASTSAGMASIESEGSPHSHTQLHRHVDSLDSAALQNLLASFGDLRGFHEFGGQRDRREGREDFYHHHQRHGEGRNARRGRRGEWGVEGQGGEFQCGGLEGSRVSVCFHFICFNSFSVLVWSFLCRFSHLIPSPPHLLLARADILRIVFRRSRCFVCAFRAAWARRARSTAGGEADARR